MNLWFRIALLGVKWLSMWFFHWINRKIHQKIPPIVLPGTLGDALIAPVKTQFRVLPTDLDYNGHMNNGIYFSLMDLGRIDAMIKMHGFWSLFSKGYYPVVFSESIRFFRSAPLFQKLTLQTKLIALEDRSIFLSQKFFNGEKLVASALIKARFRKRGRSGSVSVEEILRVAGLHRLHEALHLRQADYTQAILAQNTLDEAFKLDG